MVTHYESSCAEGLPGLSIPAVQPVVQPRDSTMWVGRCLTAERNPWGSKGVAWPPGPGSTSALIHTGRLVSASTFFKRTTEGDTASRLQNDTIGSASQENTLPSKKKYIYMDLNWPIWPLKVQLYSLLVVSDFFQPLLQRDVTVLVWRMGHDRLLGVRSSHQNISLHHVSRTWRSDLDWTTFSSQHPLPSGLGADC